jgi:hypothetical protein
VAALEGAVVLMLLERLCLTRNSSWLEARWSARASMHLHPLDH